MSVLVGFLAKFWAAEEEIENVKLRNGQEKKPHEYVAPLDQLFNPQSTRYSISFAH